MTQEVFAKSIGISKTTYNNYETGAREPRSDFWEKVAKKYNVTIDFLLGLSDKKFTTPAGTEVGDRDIFADELMKNYASLNCDGRQKLVDYSKDLVSGGRYAAVEKDAG